MIAVAIWFYVQYFDHCTDIVLWVVASGTKYTIQLPSNLLMNEDFGIEMVVDDEWD